MGVDEKKFKTIINFYLLATKLKYKIRSGWDSNHWNIDYDRLESVAEHVYGCCILALSIYSEYRYKIDIGRVLKMLLLHEIGEVFIGDITPYDNVSPEEKKIKEHDAMAKVLDGLVKKDEYLSLLYEFDEKITIDSKFAYMIDKLEADIQSKLYQDMGCHCSIEKQENNIAFQNDKVIEFIDNGAKTPFDIWYQYDKGIFEREPTFTRILKYVKENDLKRFEETL